MPVEQEGLERTRVLVADDNPAVRSVVRRYLQRRGAWVSEAGSAAEALAQLENQPHQLLITDIDMPGESGFWLRQEAQRRHPGLTVLLMTGHPESSLERAEQERERLLLKPFTLEELQRAVNAALAQARLEREVIAEAERQAAAQGIALEPTLRPSEAELEGAVRRETEARLDGRAEERPLEEEPSEEVQQEREELAFRNLVEHFPGVAYVAPLDDPGRPVYVSPQITDLVGFSHREWTSNPDLPAIRLHPDDRDMVEERRAHFRMTGRRLRVEYRLLTRDGRIIWVHDEARVAPGAAGQPRYAHGLLLDITDRKLAEESLRNLALVDELTGLYNRRGFVTLAGQQLLIAQRTKSPLLLLMVDLDNMKRINDSLGHHEGDRTLRDAAEVLTDTFRRSDVIGRIGGDEFAVLAIETEHNRQSLFAQRLEQRVAARNSARGAPPLLSLSIGTAPFDPKTPMTLEELMARADMRMYEQKTGRRN